MTKQEIRDNKPDGAKWYRIGLFGLPLYVKFEGGVWYRYVDFPQHWRAVKIKPLFIKPLP